MEKIRSDHARQAIGRKFRAVLDLNEEIDNKPVDAFRLIGKLAVRIQLIEELNKIITEHSTNYYTISVWVKELYELRELCRQQLSSSTQMARALISRGMLDGMYREDWEKPEPTELKTEEAL
jgi:uncharacterized coiled-coil protein SlyX